MPFPEKPRDSSRGVVTYADLLTRAEARRPVQIADSSAGNICRWHVERGHFQIVRKGAGRGYHRTPNLYTLTPLGELALDRLHAEGAA